MNKTVKRAFLLFVSACLIAASMLLVACGNDVKPNDAKYTDGLSYELSTDGGYYVTGFGSVTETEIKVPATYNNKPVTGIADYAFVQPNTDEGRLHLTKVVLPNGIKYIGVAAFYQCAGLTEINIPESVTAIGKQAFYRCGLKSITLSEGITEIAEETFNGCEELKYVSLPNTLTEIGDFAFRGCYGLQDIGFPESLRSIGNEAFGDCKNLTNVTLPNGVTQIGEYAFTSCSGIVSVKLPDNLTRIEVYTFEGCESLTKIDIPESVEYIGEYAFYGCYSLAEFEFPQKVTVIEEYVLSSCVSLFGVTIHSGITEIKTGAFYDCIKLVEVCNLSDLDIRAGEPSYGYVASYALNVCSNASQSKLTERADDFVVYADDDYKYIVGYVGKSEYLELPSGLKDYKLYDYAFAYNKILKSVTLTASIPEISSYAFFGCMNLNSVTIPEGVTQIGESAFEYCVIENIAFPASLNRIGRWAFGGLISLNSASFADKSEWHVFDPQDNVYNPDTGEYEPMLIAVDLTDTEQNAWYLCDNYHGYIWQRNPVL